MTTLTTNQVEPIPGYVLRERLGSGGYGEVWKADAPGGLSKAVKLVYGLVDEERASHELKALLRIKDLRHPFLLSLERIEMTSGRLVIVTELAEGSLKERYEKCREAGMPGIPRSELLQYMRDAADALDYMNEHHSLQHLDVKPENLLLIGGHVKVADFGLVKDMHQDHSMSLLAGMTPIYAACELFDANPSRRSDQYSLAIVYQYMLTGALPYPGKTAAQLANMHLHARPMLGALPPGDRKVIARALAKTPQQRFRSCRDMVEHLCDETLQRALPAADCWFSPTATSTTAPAPETAEEPILAGDRTTPLSGEASNRHTAPPLPTSVFRAPVAPLRSTADMFDMLDEAEQHCHTEFGETLELKRSEEIQLTYHPAPLLSGDTTLVPTLFLGIGQAAGLVLQQLKQRLTSATGAGQSPLADFLLLDADGSDLQRAMRGDDGEALTAHEILHIGLRKSQEYRSDSPALSQWLSRRWLFNIPRSQKPEGLRPLGRLALVDHARPIHARFKKALQRLASEECREQARRQFGYEVKAHPRVMIVGAIGGGTASGAILDLGYLARQKLEKMGFDREQVVGLLLHYLNRTPAAHELALVNSFTTLSELAWLADSAHAYPGDASSGIEAEAPGTKPFSETYLLAWRDCLSEQQLVRQTQQVADYLYLDTFTPCHEFFTAGESTTANSNAPLEVRSFGVARIGLEASPALSQVTAILASDVTQLWLAEGDVVRQAASDAVAPLAKAFLDDRRWTFTAWQEQAGSDLSKLYPQLVEHTLDELVPSGFKLGRSQLGDINGPTTRLTSALGPCTEAGPGPEGKWPSSVTPLLTLAEQRADIEVRVATELIMHSMEEAGPRTWTALQLWQAFHTQLGAILDAARKERANLFEACQQLERKLGVGQSLDEQQQLLLRKNTKEFLAQYAHYAQSRVRFVEVCLVEAHARRVRSQLARVGERVQELRRDLKNLGHELLGTAVAQNMLRNDDESLSACIRSRFETERSTLLKALDDWLQRKVFANRQGFVATIARGGEERRQLLGDIAQASHALLEECLKNIDLVDFLLTADPQTKRARYRDTMEHVVPHLLAPAHGCTLLSLNGSASSLQAAQQLLSGVDEATGATPALRLGTENDISVVVDARGQNLAAAALRLIDYRSDLIEYATRVFSRSDIPFEPISMQTPAALPSE